MADSKRLSEIEHAEKSLRDAEQASGGSDNLEIAEKLEYLAGLLKKSKNRLLEAANMEARAKVIRDKVAPDLVKVPDSQKEEERISCPYCAEKIMKEARICRYCNSTLVGEKQLIVRLFDNRLFHLGAASVLVLLVVLYAQLFLRPATKIKATRLDSASISHTEVPAKKDPLIDLVGKRFTNENQPYAYVYFRDEQNVDIRTAYVSYNGIPVGILTGHYTVTKDTGDYFAVRIEYMFNGTNTVAPYSVSTNDNGDLELVGSVNPDPLPGLLYCK